MPKSEEAFSGASRSEAELSFILPPPPLEVPGEAEVRQPLGPSSRLFSGEDGTCNTR